MFIKIIKIIIIFIILFFYLNISVSADSTPPFSPDITDPNHPFLQEFSTMGELLGLPSLDFRELVARLVRVVLGFVGTILFLNILSAGFLWMISGGNDEKKSQAKQILKSSIIGIIIIFFSYSITSFIIESFFKAVNNTPL